MKSKDNQKRVILITGANSGIGLATAQYLLKKGHIVYGVARKPYQGDFFCFSADVNDSRAMGDILKQVYLKESRLDVVINNAGFGVAGAIECATKQNIDAITQTNFVALADICSQSIAYLKEGHSKKNRARIINISSVGGIMPLPYQATYSATKAAVEVFSRALHNEVTDKNIDVCAVLPGDTKTGFTSARVFEQGATADSVTMRSVHKMEHDEQNGMSAVSVARVIEKCIVKRRPPLRVSVGVISKIEVFLSRFLSVRTLNFILKKMYG
jgi:short-subunit dehydrogenase